MGQQQGGQSIQNTQLLYSKQAWCEAGLATFFTHTTHSREAREARQGEITEPSVLLLLPFQNTPLQTRLISVLEVSPSHTTGARLISQ